MRDLAMHMVVAFALVVTRMAAFVVVSPFPPPSIPTQVRIGFTLALSLAAAPLAMGGKMPAVGLPLFVAAIGEIMTGSAIGFVFKVGMSAADVLGQGIAHASGLSMAASYDPTQGAQSDAVTRIFTTLSLLIAVSMGAHRSIIGAIVLSTKAVPVGAFLDVSVYTPGILGWLARSMEVGVGLALPAMTIAIVVQVALGLIARTAPAHQIFSVGLSITIAACFLVVMAGLRDILSGLGAHLARVVPMLEYLLATGR